MTDGTEVSGLRGNPGRAAMAGVGLLAGGTTAFVITLLVAVVTGLTPLDLSLSGLAGVAGVAGVAVAVDGARRSSPAAVVVRSTRVVAALVLLVGFALGGFLWIRLAPPREGLVRYAPAVPVVLGGGLAGVVAAFGSLFDRYRERAP